MLSAMPAAQNMHRQVAPRSLGLEQVGGRPPAFPSPHPSQRRAADSQGAAELSGAARQPSPVRRWGRATGDPFCDEELALLWWVFQEFSAHSVRHRPTDRPLLALALAPRTPDKVKNLARCAVLWRLRSSLDTEHKALCSVSVAELEDPKSQQAPRSSPAVAPRAVPIVVDSYSHTSNVDNVYGPTGVSMRACENVNDERGRRRAMHFITFVQATLLL